ncbi:hypothetical protein WJX74_003880 [Apatococcus lobatus]|uniref:Uncharacterized protein n=1 Tax=Apatococcus lobatus TaxID=904363 RepID=A0AAW1S4K3_9CHLO
MQASGVHADGFRRPVEQPGQHEGKDHLHGAELALTDQLYGRWTPTPCTPDSLKVQQVDTSPVKGPLVNSMPLPGSNIGCLQWL